MNPFRIAVACIATFAPFSTPALAQGAVDGGAVLVKVRGAYTTSFSAPYLGVALTVGDTDNPTEDQLVLEASTAGSGVTEERPMMLSVSKASRFHVTATNLSDYQVTFSAPRGYEVLINGQHREAWVDTGVQGTVDPMFEITVVRTNRTYVAPNGVGAGMVGDASSISWSAPKSSFGPPSIPWIDFNLGNAYNGEPLPPLHLLLHNRPNELEFWSASHAFYNFADSHPDLDFFEVVPLTHFRITAPQVTVEYVQTSPYATNGAANFDVRFFEPGASSPYLSYSISFATELSGSSYYYKSVTITKNLGGATSSTSLTCPLAGVTNRWNTVRLHGTWTLLDWSRGGAQRGVQVTRTETNPNNLNSVFTDTIAVGNASLTQIATNKVVNYQLVQITYFEDGAPYVAYVHAASQVTDGTTIGGGTQYVSNILLDPKNRQVGATEPAGRMSVAQYTGSGPDLRPTSVARTWQNNNPIYTPATGGVQQNGAEITNYLYQADWAGAAVLPTSIRRWQGTTLVAESSIVYTNETATVTGVPAGYPVLVATRYDFAASGAQSTSNSPRPETDGERLKSVFKTFRQDTDNRVLRGRPYGIERPDGTKLSFTYESGDYAAGVFSVPGTTGDDLRVSVYHGAASGGTIVSSVASGSGMLSIDPVRLVAMKSTRTVEILRQGRVIRRESQVYTGTTPEFEVLSWENFTYAPNGELLTRTGSTNSSYVSVWNASRSQQTITDETGAVTTINYDDSGRVANVTSEQNGTIDQVVTAYEYDGDHRTTTISQGPTTSGAERLVTTRSYTKAGLLDQVTEPGGVVTKFDYPVNARDVSATYFYGTAKAATHTTTRFLDGRVNTVAGTAVLAESYTYDFDSGRPRVTRRMAGSQRPSLQVYDLLGRVRQQAINGFGANGSNSPLFTYYDYDSKGYLTTVHTVREGPALPISGIQRMTYDEFGQLSATGIDLNNSGGLESGGIDRMQTFSQNFYKDPANVWWRRSVAQLFYENNSANSHTSETQTRLGSLPSGMLAQTVGTDFYSNKATETLYYSSAAHNRRLVSLQADGTSVERVLVNGRVAAERWFDDAHQDQSGTPVMATTYHYDLQGRLARAVDQRTGTINFPRIDYHSGTARPWKVYDARGVLTATHTYDVAGRLATTVTPAGTSNFTYTPRGELEDTSGTGAFLTHRVYNSLGELYQLHTFRNGITGGADVTAWTFDPNTGWLMGKTDSSGRMTTYDYQFTSSGREVTRTWARNPGANQVTTTQLFAYATGDLQSVTYAGQATPSGTNTPNLSYTYTRTGQLATVTDAAGQRKFYYDREQLKSEYLPAYFGSLVRTSKFETLTSTAANTVNGRYAGYMLGTDADTNPDNANADADKEMALTYGFDNFGRVGTVTTTYKAQGSRAALSVPSTYSYKDSSSMWDKLTQGGYTVDRTFENNRDVLLSISADHTNTDPIATFGYGTDDAGRRLWATQFGTAFGDFGVAAADATYNRYTYDGKGQLTAATNYRGNDVTVLANSLPGRSFSYSYDDAGNRKTVGVSGDNVAYWPTGTAGIAGAEGANNLNQPRSRATLKTRVSGTTHKDATVTVGGVTASREATPARYWDAALPSYGQNASLTVSASLPGETTQTATVKAVTRPGHEELAYDDDGNLKSDAQWDYEWDAENRLKRMVRNGTGTSWGAPNQELIFTYDYIGRRIRKVVYENGASTPLSDRKFIYDGWNLIAEIDATTTPEKIVRSYAWGLDVASSLTATGGVGAMVLQTIHTPTTLTSYTVAYDGGGNVTALVTRAPGNAADGKVAAAYEYGPFGEKVRAAVDPSLSTELKQALAAQPFRFSTKFTDVETGLIYYGLRYYDPSLGRFINRDPIEEAGGNNLYSFVGNSPVNSIDVLGMWDWLDRLLGIGKYAKPPPRDGTSPNEPTEDDDGPPPTASSRVGFGSGVVQPQPTYREGMAAERTRGLEENLRAPDSEVRRPPYLGPPVFSREPGELAARVGMMATGIFLDRSLADQEAEALGFEPPSESAASAGAYLAVGALLNQRPRSAVPSQSPSARDNTLREQPQQQQQSKQTLPPEKLPRYEGPKPTYTVNPTHVSGPTLRPGKTPLPPDAADVYRNAVPNDPVKPTAWFGRAADGRIYRYSVDKNGTAHFSGIDGVGDGVRNLTDYARKRLDGR